MKDNSISVIMPAYNSEKTILKSMKSVIKQQNLEYISEIIVINDGSTDNTKKIVENFINTETLDDLNIKIINTENKGVSSARNLGIIEAKSEWIAFLDSDDTWMQDKIAIQTKYIDLYNPDMIAGSLKETKTNKEFKIIKAKEMLFRSFPQTSTVMIKRKILKDELLFDETQSYCEDLNLFTKIAYKYKFIYIYQKLVEYGNGKPEIGSSIGLSSNIKKMNEGAQKNIKDFLNFGIINYFEYLFFIFFNLLKYIRRILIVITRRK